MKYLCILALILFSLTTVHETVMAQELSKKERKRLKKEQKKRLKELKSMSAEDFQKAQDIQTALKASVAELESKATELNSQLSDKDAEVKQLKDQVRRLEQQLEQAKASAAQANNASAKQSPATTDAYDKGLAFRVQIGAFRDKNLEQYLNNSTSFNGETNEQGMQLYTLGNFRDYWEADKFKKYLRAMGVRDAWIVPYQEGQRVALKDVLENLQKKAVSESQTSW